MLKKSETLINIYVKSCLNKALQNALLYLSQNDQAKYLLESLLKIFQKNGTPQQQGVPNLSYKMDE